MIDRAALFSIRSRHAQRIYSGSKLYEYRRCHIQLDVGCVCYVYETAPISAVTGEFVVTSVVCASPAELVELESDPIERAALARYLDGARRASAIQIGTAARWCRGRALAEFGVSRPPQSYCYLPVR